MDHGSLTVLRQSLKETAEVCVSRSCGAGFEHCREARDVCNRLVYLRIGDGVAVGCQLLRKDKVACVPTRIPMGQPAIFVGVGKGGSGCWLGRHRVSEHSLGVEEGRARCGAI